MNIKIREFPVDIQIEIVRSRQESVRRKIWKIMEDLDKALPVQTGAL